MPSRAMMPKKSIPNKYIVSSVLELLEVSDPEARMHIMGPLIDYVGTICLTQLDNALDHFLHGTEATLGRRVFVPNPSGVLLEDFRRFSHIMWRIFSYGTGIRVPAPATLVAVFPIEIHDTVYLSGVLRGMFAGLALAEVIDEITARMNDIHVFLTRLEVSGLSDSEIAAICEPAYSYHTLAVSWGQSHD